MFIEVKNAVRYYGQDELRVHALNSIDLSLDKGKIYVILGPSGSGKSTLLNMLGGLDRLDSGKITVDGTELTGLSKKETTEYRRKSVGFVFQFYNLIPDLTVKENVEAVRDISDKPFEIDDMLDALGIKEYADRFPRELSGGQQQRVSIARALALKPKILFFDEPTSALDPELTGEILKVIKELAKEKMTMVIVTHEMAFARDVANHVIFMDEGVIVEEGSPEDLFGNTRIDRTKQFLARFKD